MVVTNIGLVACKRDVGAAVLAAYVYGLDNTRLWSNLDCAPSNETLVKTFNPGEQVTTEVTWTGMGSGPGCPLPRQPIGPGTYNLVVQLGNLRSAAVPFILAQPAPEVRQAPAPAEGAPAARPGAGARRLGQPVGDRRLRQLRQTLADMACPHRRRCPRPTADRWHLRPAGPEAIRTTEPADRRGRTADAECRHRTVSAGAHRRVLGLRSRGVSENPCQRGEVEQLGVR